MKSFLAFITLIGLAVGCESSEDNDTGLTPQEEIRGADLSFLPEMETAGVTFSDSSGSSDLLLLMKKHGYTTIRLRIWNNPQARHSTVEEVVGLSKRIKNAGLDVWLDFHYSDTWADPGNQTPPVAWQGLSGQILADSLYLFTKNSLLRFQEAGIYPSIVQIGNEINGGFLWPLGAVSGSDTSRWNFFRSLLNAGLSATREVFPSTRRMIHIAGIDAGFWFFGNLMQKQVDFELIGVSFYPWWHGKDLQWVEITLEQLFKVTEKPVIIAETAYPWTFGWNDWTNNIIGDSSQTHPDYQPTAIGQAQFLEKIKSLAISPDGMPVVGVCYWAPDWLSAYGPKATNGSSWENLTLFDFNGKALPGFYELGKKIRSGN